MVLAELLHVVAFRSELAARLTARADESVDAVVSALYAELGSLHGSAKFSEVENLRARVRATVDSFARFVAQRELPGGSEREGLHRMGAERARRGVPFDAVNDSVDITMGVLWRLLRDAVQQAPVPQVAAAVVADIGMEAPAFTGAIRDAVLSGYALERRHGEIGRIYGVADIVDVLVDGRWVNRRELVQAADALGIDISEPLALLFVVAPGPHQHRRLEEAARQVAAAVPGASAGRLRGDSACYVPVVLAHADSAALREQVAEAAQRCGVVVVMDDTAHDHRGLAAAGRRLEQEVAPALALGRGPGTVATPADTELYRLLRAVPSDQRMAYTRRVLGPVLDLPAGKAADAIATMQAYFRGRAAGRLDERAADLRLHRNSFRYRLDRTQALLGVSFRDASDRLRVEVALALHELAHQEIALQDAAERDDEPPEEAGNG